MKIKTAIITAISAVSALAMSVSAAETTAVTTTSAVTTSTTVSETSITTTTHIPTAGSVIVDREKVTDNDYLNEILGYVGEDNAPNLNNNLRDNAMTISSSTIDYSDKAMYTVTTRSGDVFYLIINSDDGSCLFLNSVDTADLTSMLNKGSTKNTMNENALEDIAEMEKEQAMTETIPINDAVKGDTKSEVKSDGSIFDSLWWIIGAGVLCVVVAIIVAVIKRKKNGNSGYDDLDSNNGYPDVKEYDDE